MKPYRMTFNNGFWKLYKLRGVMYFRIGSGVTIHDACYAAWRKGEKISIYEPARAFHR